MGHYASEIDYETPQERTLSSLQYVREMNDAYTRNGYQPCIGDDVEMTEEGWYSLGILVSMWPWKKVERIKTENGKTFISFETEEEANRARANRGPFSDNIAWVTGITEWYDAKHFQKIVA